MSFRKKNDNGNEYFYEVTLPTLAYYMHFMHAVLQDANACNAQFFFEGFPKNTQFLSSSIGLFDIII